MIEIDGSQGEGGGQIIRSSLALAAVTRQPIKLKNIRAGRSKPGLMRQHLTAVRAVTEICEGKVDGDEIGSKDLTFEPGEIRSGEFEYQVGTAGSASLVAQTVLPALMLADSPTTLTLKGGTHNPWAPPFDFLQRTYLPQLAKFGPKVTAELQSYGFYPAGGGGFELRVQPSKELCGGFELLERGGDVTPKVAAIVSAIPKSVGERECDTIRRKANWRSECFHVHEVEDPRGPGNVVMIELEAPSVTEIFVGFGKAGVKAERVARGVYREAKKHIATGAPVGEHLADQLMMPMGLAASQGHSSQFRTSVLSMHSKTHLDVLKIFLPIETDIEEEDSGTYLVRFMPASNS